MKSLRRTHTSSSKSPLSTHPNSSIHSSPSSSSSSPSASWVHLRSVLFVVGSSSSSSSASSSLSSSDRGHLKSPWSRRRRKHALKPQQWRSLFTSYGKLRDGGVKLLKKVRSGGIDPSIRAEVWPFLLGVYDVNSSKEERGVSANKNRKEYEKLRRQCRRLIKQNKLGVIDEQKETEWTCSNEISENPISEPSSPTSDDIVSARDSLSSYLGSSDFEFSDNPPTTLLDGSSSSQRVTSKSPFVINTDSSDSESSEFDQFDEASPFIEENNQHDPDTLGDPSSNDVCCTEDFSTWHRIIRLDAIRANAEWIPFSPSQAKVSEDRARRCAKAVGLKDYDHLEPCRIYHAARLVAVLEAYAIYDSETGYCQGMSDLLSPIISAIEEDQLAFWCFTGFMKKTRYNFRLDEVGIRRQLEIVAKIIKYKDSHFYRHLVKLEAEDCFFVYRMVVVLFRRELSFEQTLCLWEVMWADQAALRVGIGKSAWSRIRQRAPPTEDLLLYAIAASVMQRRKQIIDKFSSMDEILRECNNMAGHLDVWKLLDDAHDLVMTLDQKINANG